MSKFKLPYLVLFASILSACSTLPSTFTAENMIKTHPGMSSDEILEMYGKPKSIKNTTCGSSMDNLSSCTIWKYGESLYDQATFYFSGSHGSYILNSFDIEKD